jgi:hypothetical protein
VSCVLYAAQVDVSARNGNLQRQEQLLRHLARSHPGRVDVLSLQSRAADTEAWARDAGIDIRVLHGAYPSLARWNARSWYFGHVLACNRGHLGRHFRFPVTTPLPRAMIARYDAIVS